MDKILFSAFCDIQCFKLGNDYNGRVLNGKDIL
jgi:hypothetical protein